jgi:hypothetical protein
MMPMVMLLFVQIEVSKKEESMITIASRNISSHHAPRCSLCPAIDGEAHTVRVPVVYRYQVEEDRG